MKIRKLRRIRVRRWDSVHNSWNAVLDNDFMWPIRKVRPCATYTPWCSNCNAALFPEVRGRFPRDVVEFNEFEHNVMGFSQPIVRMHMHGMRYRYYDGMTLAVDPVTHRATITSPLKPIKRKRINAEKVAAFERGMEESGFKDAFKVLHAVSEPPTTSKTYRSHSKAPRQYLMDNQYAEEWPALIAAYAHESVYDYNLGRRVDIKFSASDTWKKLMNECKKVMYEVVDSEHTELA